MAAVVDSIVAAVVVVVTVVMVTIVYYSFDFLSLAEINFVYRGYFLL